MSSAKERVFASVSIELSARLTVLREGYARRSGDAEALSELSKLESYLDRKLIEYDSASADHLAEQLFLNSD